MRKMIFILCIPTALLSACSPSGMQGNPAAVQAGAAIGGVLGAIVGDRAGGYNGSQFGALLGTVTGAAVGNAITTPREKTYQVEEYYVKTYPSSSQYEHTSSYEPLSGLRIINLRFIDDNRNHVIDAEEDSKLVFDVVNDGDVPAYNVTPVIEEMSGMKHILISPSAQIAYMPVGNQIRYTATIRRDPASQGTYFFIRFWVGKVNSCASVTAPLLSVAKTRNCAWPVFNFLPPRMVAVYLI